MSVSEIAACAGAAAEWDLPASGDIEIEGITWDSRAVRPGNLYVALPGERVDGHDFAAPAVAAGARAVLAAHDIDVDAPVIVVDDVQAALARIAGAWRSHMEGVVVGLTGSTGKTTTKNLVACVLGCAGPTVATIANQNNEIGVPNTLLACDADTAFAVVEMGMRGSGQIAELCTFSQPDWGLVTNAGESHIELLGSREAIAQAKAELFCALPTGGVAFVNEADDFAEQMRAQARLDERGVATVYFCGHEVPDDRVREIVDAGGAIVWASGIELDGEGRPSFTMNACGFDALGAQGAGATLDEPEPDGSSAPARAKPFVVRGRQAANSPLRGSDRRRLTTAPSLLTAREVASEPSGSGSSEAAPAPCAPTVDGMAACSLQLLGLHNVSNACSAAAVGLVAGLTLRQCCEALSQAQPERGRQQVFRTDDDVTIVDDSYNANPDSMRASLSTFAALEVPGRHIAVLGDMLELGEFARECHERVGAFAAASSIDVLVCVGELSASIADAAKAAGMDDAAITRCADAAEALSAVRALVAPGDAVLVKASHSIGLERVVEGLVG